MEQLGQVLGQCINEYSQAYEDRFMKSELERANKEQISDKLSHDNKLLKRAVKILYNRLSQTRH